MKFVPRLLLEFFGILVYVFFPHLLFVACCCTAFTHEFFYHLGKQPLPILINSMPWPLANVLAHSPSDLSWSKHAYIHQHHQCIVTHVVSPYQPSKATYLGTHLSRLPSWINFGHFNRVLPQCHPQSNSFCTVPPTPHQLLPDGQAEAPHSALQHLHLLYDNSPILLTSTGIALCAIYIPGDQIRFWFLLLSTL